MNYGWLIPLAAIIIGPLSWVLVNWIRARHGYSLDDDDDGEGGVPTRRQAELLSKENERLKGQVTRLEERIAVLERIATDKPSRLSAEIDNLL